MAGFREGLYYRFVCNSDPLAATSRRLKDIPVLIRHFCNKHGGRKVTFAPDAVEALEVSMARQRAGTGKHCRTTARMTTRCYWGPPEDGAYSDRTINLRDGMVVMANA